LARYRRKNDDPATALYPEDHWTAIFRLLPGYAWFREWRARSWILFVVSAAFAVMALAFDASFDWQEARYARERTFATGTVLGSGFLLPRTSRGDDPPEFCYVRYRFSVAGEARSRTAWRIWKDACWAKSGTPIRVEYVASNPSMNRPAGSGGKGSVLVVPMWVIAIALAGWGFLVRRAEGAVAGSGAYAVDGVVVSIAQDREERFLLTYSYEAGVRGTQYGHCEIAEDAATRLSPGTKGTVMVDPIHPARSDWIGPASPA
jgi:hypothetical protein